MSLCIDPDKMLGAADQREEPAPRPVAIEVNGEWVVQPDGLAEPEGRLRGQREERARCRAIILKHLSNDWTANKVLEEIGDD